MSADAEGSGSQARNGRKDPREGAGFEPVPADAVERLWPMVKVLGMWLSLVSREQARLSHLTTALTSLVVEQELVTDAEFAGRLKTLDDEDWLRSADPENFHHVLCRIGHLLAKVEPAGLDRLSPGEMMEALRWLDEELARMEGGA